MANSILWNRIPELLRPAVQWVVSRPEERVNSQGVKKITKPPYHPRGFQASHSDPTTWVTLAEAKAAVESGSFHWPGFVVTKNDPVAAIDLDHCRDAETGKIEEWAEDVLSRIQTYAEVSPSGTGVHLLFRSAFSVPGGGKTRNGMGESRCGKIELYSQLRYVTVTGRKLKDAPADLADCTDEFRALFAELFPESEKPAPAPSPPAAPDLDDYELQRLMFTSASGAAILRLWNGDLSAHDGDHSAADLALCNRLAFWCGGDPARVDHLFRQSKLMRPKWDEKRGDSTYGAWTVGLACSECKEFYSGPSQRFEVEESGRAEPTAETLAELAQAQAFAATLADRLKADTGCVFEAETLRLLGCLRALDLPNWQRCKEALRKAKVSLRELEAKMPAPSEFLPTPERADLPGQRAGDTLEDCPAPTLVIPHPYYVENTLTGKVGADQEGRLKSSPIAAAPILITGRTKDALSGDESLLLAWRWPESGWQSRIVSRDEALSSRDLAKLAKAGMPVGEANSKDLAGYIQKLDEANHRGLPTARVSSHLGWQGDPLEASFLCGKQLILPNGEIETADALDIEHPETWNDRRVCFHGSGEGQEQIVEAYHARGNYAGWLEAIAPLADYPKALLVFYAGLGSVLLPLLGVPNFVIDISHDTTVGKTTTLRCAGSHWGNPDERSAFSVLLTFDTSRVGLERYAEVLHCLPLLIDDTKKARGKQDVPDRIYAMVGGRGRVRGNPSGLAHVGSWRLITIVTGEASAVSHSQDGGTRTRTLSLGGFPFGAQSAELNALTKRVNVGVTTHYGHSGPRFLAWLMTQREKWDQWREYHASLAATYATQAKIPEAGRLADYAALITVAGAMAHRALPLPWEFQNPLESLWADLAAGAAGASGAERALETVLSWAHTKERMFIGRQDNSDAFSKHPPDTLGRWDDADSWEYLAVYPTVLDRMLEEHGFSADAIKKSWRSRGWLEHDPQSFTKQVPIRDGTRSGRMVKILRAAFDSLEVRTE